MERLRVIPLPWFTQIKKIGCSDEAKPGSLSENDRKVDKIYIPAVIRYKSLNR
jgi:hypothetical protein